MLYSKSTTHLEAFATNVFKNFTDVAGGSPYEMSTILHNRFTVDDFAYHDDMYYFGIVDYFNKTVIPHKIEVYKAGKDLLKNEKVKEILRIEEIQQFRMNLWLHDLSKFSATEAFGYAMYNRETGHGKEGFESAWHHHKMNNPHHPEYWLNPNRSGVLEPLPMPNIYSLEMVANWIGAGKTYGSTLEVWLPENITKFKFKNRSKVAEIIRDFTGVNVLMDGNGGLVVEDKTQLV